MTETIKEAIGLRDKIKQGVITCEEGLQYLDECEALGHYVSQKARDWIKNYKKRNK